MKLFTLYRYDLGADNTLGILFYEGQYVCDTLELPWRNNERQVSCIPDGDYHIEEYSSPHFEECIVVKDVPDRDGILIHPANTVTELKGCIAVGIKSLEIVLHSKDSLSKVLSLLGSDKGILEIKRV